MFRHQAGRMKRHLLSPALLVQFVEIKMVVRLNTNAGISVFAPLNEVQRDIGKAKPWVARYGDSSSKNSRLVNATRNTWSVPNAVLSQSRVLPHFAWKSKIESHSHFAGSILYNVE
jgi:hypothetical protein